MLLYFSLSYNIDKNKLQNQNEVLILNKRQAFI